jgi:PhnB protein
MSTSPIPDDFTAPIPMLAVHDALAAIDFYREAFGGEEVLRMLDDEGKVGHAELKIGPARFMIADEYDEHNRSPRQLGGSSVILYLYVDDADTTFLKAVAEGAKPIRPVADQFYGDRMGKLEDPFGHVWMVASRKEDLTLEEISHRAEEAPND